MSRFLGNASRVPAAASIRAEARAFYRHSMRQARTIKQMYQLPYDEHAMKELIRGEFKKSVAVDPSLVYPKLQKAKRDLDEALMAWKTRSEVAFFFRHRDQSERLRGKDESEEERKTLDMFLKYDKNDLDSFRRHV